MGKKDRANRDMQAIRRIFYAFSLVILGIVFYNNLLLHQMQSPVLIYPHADNTYWLLHYLGIPQFLVGSFSVSLVFDLALISSAILSMVYLKNRIYPWMFLVLFLLYFITYNSYLTHHSHGFIGMLIMSGIFCFRSASSFARLFSLLRYYTLFILVSAALWKIGRGSIFNPDQMFEILKIQHLYQLIHQPESFYSSFIYWLIDHQVLAQIFYLFGCLVQLSFIIGFFTKKYDKFLIVFFFAFFLSNYFFMDLSFYKLYILSITLFTWKGLEAVEKDTPLDEVLKD